MKFSISISAKTRFIYALLLALLLSGVVVTDALRLFSAEKETSLLLSDEENKSETDKSENKEGKSSESGFDGNDFENSGSPGQSCKNCHSHYPTRSYYSKSYFLVPCINLKSFECFLDLPAFPALGLSLLYHSLVFYEIL